MAGVGLALAAVGFGGVCTQGQGQSLGCFHSSHGGSPCITTAILVPDFSGLAPKVLCWWLCEQCLGDTRASRLHSHSGGALRAVPASVFGEPTQHVVGDTTEHSPGVQLRGSSPSGRAPVPPNSHCSSETDLGAPLPTTREQTLPLPGQ